MRQSMIYMQGMATQTGLSLSRIEAAMGDIMVIQARIDAGQDVRGWGSFKNGQMSMLESLGAGHYTIINCFEALIDERKENA